MVRGRTGWLAALLAGSVALAIPVSAAAAVITSQVGDADGFGLGVADGDGFFVLDVLADPSDPAATDTLLADAVVHHVYALSGQVVSASLELFTGGWGTYGPARVLFNGTDIGALSLGEVADDSLAHLDVFDLAPVIGLLTGNDVVAIAPIAGFEIDRGVLDYARLRVVTDATAVPEPGALPLVAWALAAAAVMGLRRPARVRSAIGLAR